MGAIYLVRHGQASFGAADYDQLSELGVRQSRLLGQWLAQTGQDMPLLVTGSHRRHLQSSAACLEALPLATTQQEREVLQDPGFDEFDHQQVLLRLMPQFSDRAVLSAYLAQQEHPVRAFQQIFAKAVARWVGGEHDADYSEPWPQFKARCNAAMARLLEHVGKGQSAWVFTSGGPVSVICQQLLAIPDRQIFDLNWALVNTGVTKLLCRPGHLSLSYLNSFAHLESACDPTLVSYR
ncbi:Phosphoglycerate mutase family protein [Collimonas arenae]|uniref:Phosphoglycerate mutase family protein n=1 Tax=Collimonas arenae TaxID=279058 RepID=A0A0A1FKR3_9BURK|nr:histidine phosphatase family protein [Collimonas arenae]AIY43517.1 Phosphoglycerate mutase family protein [Collimonas arenae]